MNEFEVYEICPNVYSVLDAGSSSFYVIEGEKLAAVIDTGITAGKKILPLIRTITEKSLVLALTHTHPDHMYHADEFDVVYMCHEELTLPRELLDRFCAGKQLDLQRTVDIRTDSEIDLGGKQLVVCQLPGHTPGSVVFWDRQDDLLFTGDAIGSGYGVWMQVSGALPLDQYCENLRFLLRWLVDRGGRMKFFGGHNNQQNQSRRVPGYNPLNLGLLCDLIDLTDGLVKGTIAGHPSDAKSFDREKTYYAGFGRAEIEYRRSNMHSAKNTQN